MTIAERAHELANLKSLIEQAEGELKVLKRLFEEKAEAVKEIMAAEGMSNLKIDTPDGPRTLFPRVTIGARVEDGEGFGRWCQEHGIDRQAYRQWSGSKLASLARECRDEGKPMPPGLDVYEKVQMSVRRS